VASSADEGAFWCALDESCDWREAPKREYEAQGASQIKAKQIWVTEQLGETALALDLARLATTLAADADERSRKAANSARAQAHEASTFLQRLVLFKSSDQPHHDVLQTAFYLYHNPYPLDPRFEADLVRLCVAETVAPAAAVLRRALAQQEAAAQDASLEERPRPLIQLAAAAAAGAGISLSRLGSALDAIGSPQDVLALASWGEEGVRKKRPERRRCAFPACRTHGDLKTWGDGAEGAARKRCSRCLQAYFCDEACWKNALDAHRPLCSVLRAEARRWEQQQQQK
jgi:hypothetical protein